MRTYIKPAVASIGSLHEMTLSNITKVAGSGDTITIAGVAQPAPGSSVISVSP